MRHRLIALLVLLGLLVAAPAAFASGRTVIGDCTDDEVLSRTYTQQEYRDALRQLPADADQYGNCRDIIARAQERAATKGAKGTKRDDGNATGATFDEDPPSAPKSSDRPADEQLAAASPADRKAAQEAAAIVADDAAGPGNPVAAGKVGVKPASSAGSDLPTPVVVLLALLLAGALALAAVRLRSLVDARRA
jgi:hypothetical protein